VTDLLASDGVLLVMEGEVSPGDWVHVPVIQSVVRGEARASAHHECDVLQAEGLRTAGVVGVQILGGAEEPEEANDDEVDGMLVGSTFRGVVGVEDVREVCDDGHIDGVSAGAWVIGGGERAEVTSQ